MEYYKRHTVAEVPVGSNITVFAGCEGILIHLLLYPKIASLERIDLWQRHFSWCRLKHREVLCSIKKCFWSTACCHFQPVSSLHHEVTRVHVKIRQMYTQPKVTILFLCLLFACSCVGLAWMILFMWPGSCQQDSLADCKAPWNVKKLFLGLYRIKNWSSGGSKSCHCTERHMLSGCVIRSCCFIVFSLIRQQPTL